MDDASFEQQVPDDALEAVRRELGELGRAPLPPGAATRLDARLAAELASTPLAQRRARSRHLRAGGALAAAAALAAALVFALTSGGGGRPLPEAAALRTTALSTVAAADSAAKTAAGAAVAGAPPRAAAARCAASRRAGDRPRAGCPGARGGHARAV